MYYVIFIYCRPQTSNNNQTSSYCLQPFTYIIQTVCIIYSIYLQAIAVLQQTNNSSDILLQKEFSSYINKRNFFLLYISYCIIYSLYICVRMMRCRIEIHLRCTIIYIQDTMATTLLRLCNSQPIVQPVYNTHIMLAGSWSIYTSSLFQYLCRTYRLYRCIAYIQYIEK